MVEFDSELQDAIDESYGDGWREGRRLMRIEQSHANRRRKEPPTDPGWYWWKWKADASWTIVRCVRQSEGAAIFFWDNTRWTPVAGLSGEWVGPIAEPA